MRNQQVSAAKVARIEALLAAGLTQKAAAARERVGPTVVNKIAKGQHVHSTRPRASSAEVPPAPSDPVAEEAIRTTTRAQQAEYIEALREHSFRRFLTTLVEAHVRPALPAPPPVRARIDAKASVRYPFLHLSDWHFEEIVNPAGVLGLNHYDIPTACKRVHRVVHAACAWKRDIEAAGRFKIPELVVGLNGDFLTGTLHGLEKHSDAPNVVRAALACGDLVALALRDLAAVFPKVRVYGVVGNHGRLPDAKKVPTKDPTRSWDYLAYQTAKRILCAQTNVQWTLPDSYGVTFEVGGHLAYMAHGNFIPNNLGVVGYGVRRFTSSLASNLQAAGQPLRYAFFGHWHASQASEFSGIQAFVGPSLIGTQEYGFLSGGAVNRPAQDLHVFDRELGHVTRECLFGEGSGFGGTYELEI